MDRFIEELSNIAKVIVKDEPKPDTVTVTGRAKEYNGKMYVQIDGSDQLTPIASSTVGIKTDDWVTVQIKNHSATVTGNATDPSPGTSYADEIKDKVDDVSDQISEFEIVIADKVDTDQLNAVNGRIDNLVSENVTITGKLDAVEGEIDQLQAENVTITGELDAAKADIDQLESSKADITVLESQYAKIENLEATNANIHNLEVDYGSFKQVTTEELSAINGHIENLDTTKLDAESADIRYAQIDFANIGEAAIEKLFTDSGIIGDLVVSEGHITGHLVGVTISGDLIEGNTIKADKLVVLGSDGLYYKLNVNAESVAAEQTDYNSINGKIITANTITAEKINVDDLVAFNATIGGFHLSSGSMYSGAKASVDNTTAGTYLGSDGQLNIGDKNQYLKFYKDSEGVWKLEIAASAIKMGTTSVVDKINEIEGKVEKSIKSSVEQFYLSTSPTALSGGSWSASQPTWQDGRYIWRRTLVTYNDGSSTYTPSVNGVCITGNTGPQGDRGSDGTSVTITSTVVDYQASTSGTTPPTGSWTTSIPSVSAGSYLWTRTKVSYSDGKSTTSYSVSRQGSNGAPGSDGADGTSIAITNTAVTYASSTSGTSAPSSGWQSTVPSVAQGSYLWTKTVVTYSDGKFTTAYSVSRQGADGERGPQGVQGPPGEDGRTLYTWIKYADTPTSGMSDSPTGKEYIGIAYNKTSSTESSNYSDYTWSKIVGDQGPQGPSGTDGQTLYTWIKYADSATGSGMSDNPTGKEYIGIAYNKTTATESNTASDYTWSLIKGSDGIDGTDGVGVKSSAVTYQAGSSGTTVPTGTWSSSIPSVSAGQYLWTKTVITYTDGKSTTSYSVGRMGQNGANGANGDDGRGIESTAIAYQAHSSQTSTPTGTWSSSIPTLSPSKPYLWTRTVIIYTDNATTTSYSVSSTLDGIEIGGRNILRDTKEFTRSSNLTSGDNGALRRYGCAIQSDDYLGLTVRGSTSVPVNSPSLVYAEYTLIDMAYNDMFTMSFYAKGTASSVRAYFYGPTGYVRARVVAASSGSSFGNTYSDGSCVIPISEEWERYWVTWQLNSTGDLDAGKYVLLRSDSNTVSNANAYVCGFKLEKGNKPTDWTPAPEDVDQKFDDQRVELQEEIDTSIEQVEGQIISTVQATYTTKDEFENEIATIGTQITQNQESVNFQFSQLNGSLADLNSFKGTAGSQLETITKYIRFLNGDIVLGGSDSKVQLKLENDRISFLDNNNEVMYITDEELSIMRAIIATQLTIGDFSWVPRSNGNVSFRYIGS